MKSLDNDDLEKILNDIDEKVDEKEAILGIYSKNGQYYFKGNKAGLELYAAKILAVAYDVNQEEGYFSMEWYEPWMDSKSEITIDYFETYNKEELVELYEKRNETKWMDKITEKGCLLLIFILLIIMIVGFVTIIKYIF